MATSGTSFIRALWNPLNLHRILGNMAFGGGVVAAYAAYRFLSAKTDEERAHYDGWVTSPWPCRCGVPLPFAGYWLMREAYAYRQQMGITLMGGLLAWLFIIQATMIRYLVFEHQLLPLASPGANAWC